MTDIQAWTLIPFIVMLLMIAVVPLFASKFWESNRNKLICTLAIAVPTAIYLCCIGLGHQLIHQIAGDYFPFIVLLLALFVVTGGIQIKGDVAATPIVNGVILSLGFLLASIMGTTGAAMLLIRPLLQINKQRVHKTHTVLFFIAMVANCGGILSPLGDPPLFLLYLRGTPFGWFTSLAPQWVFTGILLLAIYLIWDTIMFRKEPREARKADLTEISPIRVKGRINFIWLLCIMLAVIFLNEHYIPAMGREGASFFVQHLREWVLGIIILLSLRTTSQTVRKGNSFSWGPILEVAILFVGIFTTMTPALLFLNQNAMSLGLSAPWQFYYSTGALSAFLDNSPTAVAFYSVASGLDLSAFAGGTFVAGIPEILLKAISLGAVFFGSLTYIGNGPNFMVKAIAEESGVKMPSFFGYMLKFSLITLLPVYVLVQLLFL
ncbi:MAG: sodium:proton antiporter [Bacteroidales bacterium]|nr:sodium:proton antiporter [Candidatus Cryptobacteroides aphodequi]